jgi:hypothetical protein
MSMPNNLTRIKNNQITDSTIQAGAKLAAGSITGNLLATTVTFNSNITILGNLTVSNSFSQLNSINTYINDPIVVFIKLLKNLKQRLVLTLSITC